MRDLGSLRELRQRDEDMAALRARRSGQPRVLKQLSASTELLLQEAVAAGSQGPISPALTKMLTQTRSAATWDRYAGVFRAWRAYAAAHQAPCFLIDPTMYATFMAEAGESETGYTQTKMRACAADAFCKISGTPHRVPAH